MASSLNNLATLYQEQGKYAKARPLYQRALAIRERVLEPEHPDMASSFNNLGLFYQAQGKHAEAEPLFQRALAIRERVLGPENGNGTFFFSFSKTSPYHTMGDYFSNHIPFNSCNCLTHSSENSWPN